MYRWLGLIIWISSLVSNAEIPLARAENPATAIGILAPLTGVRSDAGAFQRNAASLAAEQWNQSSPSRRPVRLLFEDTRYSARDAVSSYRKLKGFEGVSFFIGPYGSSEVMAVAPLSERDKSVLLLPGAQSEEISGAGELIFRLIHNSAQEAPFFGTFVAKQMRDDTLFAIVGMTAFSPPYLKRFRESLEAGGKKLDIVSEFEVTTTDFRTLLTKLKGRNPKEVMMIATPLNAAHILTQAHELGIEAQWYNIGVEGPELTALARSVAKGLYYPYSFECAPEDGPTASFCSLYRKRFGTEPDAIACNTYDAVMLLAQCIEKVGLRAEDVASCLYGTRDYHGVSGIFSIDSHGDAIRPLLVKRL